MGHALELRCPECGMSHRGAEVRRTFRDIYVIDILGKQLAGRLRERECGSCYRLFDTVEVTRQRIEALDAHCANEVKLASGEVKLAWSAGVRLTWALMDARAKFALKRALASSIQRISSLTTSDFLAADEKIDAFILQLMLEARRETVEPILKALASNSKLPENELWLLRRKARVSPDLAAMLNDIVETAEPDAPEETSERQNESEPVT